tara:strand:- start:361 stop:489 length:129 start_codon:yes stop_codon:yes gene_type:complete
MLERAIKWGGLSFPELINAMIENDTALTSVYSLTGLEKTSQE